MYVMEMKRMTFKLVPGRRRHRNFLIRHQRRARDMRPSQALEIQKDQLRILNLDRSNSQSLGRRDRPRRHDHEPRHRRARMRRRGRNFQRRVPDLVLRNHNLMLHLLDPKRGRHLRRVGVGVGGLGGVAL